MPGGKDRTERIYQVGEFWLDRHPKSPYWQICRYNERKRQVSWKTTAETDLGRAKEKLDEHFIEHRQPDNERPQDALLDEILADYLEDHMKGKESEGRAATAIEYITAHFDGAVVSEVTRREQRKLIKKLEDREYSGAYIDDILGVLRAALNYAIDQERLDYAPKILTYERGASPNFAMSLEELAAIVDAIRYTHLKKWMIVSLATAARSSTVLDLTPAQANFEFGWIDLNPAGRKQTKKYRPIIPMTDALQPHMATDSEFVVSYAGGKCDSVKHGFAAAKKRAGLDRPTIKPRSVRETMATLMRGLGVPAWEVSGFLGHRRPETTERYAHYAPDYMSHARLVVDAIIQELNDMVALDLLWTGSNSTKIGPRKEADNRLVNIRKRLVGERGFEPPAPTSRTKSNSQKSAKIYQLEHKRAGRK